MKKATMRKMSIVFFGLFCFLFVLTQAAVAQEKPVTSDKLSIEDVKSYLEKYCLRGGTLEHVFGIYQEGTHATVYFQIKYLLSGTSMTMPTNLKLGLVKLNSGQWFDPEDESFRFVTK